MPGTLIDMETWPRAAQYRWFRSFERPHFASTVRLDVTRLMDLRKPQGVSPYRASLFAIGSGLEAVPALRQRFHADGVIQHEAHSLSMTVPREDGTFGLAYVPFIADFSAFDAEAKARIAAARAASDFLPDQNPDGAVAYMSCLPWLDFTSLDNALQGPEDCIPRIGWGKIVQEGARWRMAMSLQVHHALVDGAPVGTYFETVQETLDTL